MNVMFLNYEQKVRFVFGITLFATIYFLLPNASSAIHLLYLVSLIVLLCTFTEFFLKICSLVFKPIREIDDESVVLALVNRFDRKHMLVTLACLIFVMFTRSKVLQPFLLVYNSELTLFCFVIFVYILLKELNFSERLPSQSIQVESMKGLDYGTGLAYSFYYGYLRIILPSTGTQIKGMLEKMEDYEDREKIQFAVKKLFILIPSSSYIPPDLKVSSNGWMDAAKQLEEEVRDRCGVKQRMYKNTVYKIHLNGLPSKNKPIYVAAEGATPVYTFYQLQKHSDTQSHIYRRYTADIVGMFYKTLKRLIENDPQCRNVCELVHYNDCHPSGQTVNVAKVLLQRIEEIKKAEDIS